MVRSEDDPSRIMHRARFPIHGLWTPQPECLVPEGSPASFL